ncbi:hypothetical protein [Stieleria sp.]|uniref:hypothetical protein n=1 Tax=Stieleria sp. TaxID=2795976 RepID=UPI0035663F30
MARRKPPTKTSRGPTADSPDGGIEPPAAVPADPAPNASPANAGPANDGSAPNAAAVDSQALPSSTWTGLISAAILVHLFALFVSYTAIIEPSTTHSSLLDLLSPYLRSTHFAADGRRFYLAHATPDEQPHRLQFASAADGDTLVIDRQTEWTTIEPSGIAGLAESDRYGRWMGLVATLAQSDRPSLAAALLMPLVAADPSIEAVRIVRLPTQLTTAADDAAPPVYLARVVRDANEVRLVSIGAKRLSTYSREQDADAAGKTSGGEAVGR